jgi:hypothetical protein
MVVTGPSRAWHSALRFAAAYARRSLRSRTTLRATCVQRERADTGSLRVHRRSEGPQARRRSLLRNRVHKPPMPVPAAPARCTREPLRRRTRPRLRRRSGCSRARSARAAGEADPAGWRRRAGRERPRRPRPPRGRPSDTRSRRSRPGSTRTRSFPDARAARCTVTERGRRPRSRRAPRCSARGRQSSRCRRARTTARRREQRIHAALRPRRRGTRTGPRTSA